MLYLLWLAPVVLLIVLIGVFRQPVIRSAMLGAALALLVAFLSAPRVFGFHEAILAVARGSWIGLTVVPYILGGLLFWRVASLVGEGGRQSGTSAPAPAPAANPASTSADVGATVSATAPVSASALTTVAIVAPASGLHPVPVQPAVGTADNIACSPVPVVADNAARDEPAAAAGQAFADEQRETEPPEAAQIREATLEPGAVPAQEASPAQRADQAQEPGRKQVPNDGEESVALAGGAAIAQVHAAAEAARAAQAQRRILFNACFLIGPFAESVTGFGVGMMGTFALLATLSLRPAYLLAFGFIGQALGPWGGMASGTLIAAALAGSNPATFAVLSGGMVSLMLLAWLPLFWRLAAHAGLPFPRDERRKDAAWLAGTLLLLLLMTWLGGPETGLIASFGPVIALRYFLSHDAKFSSLWLAARQVWPYILLVAGLALTRLIPSWARFLRETGSIRPFENLPAFSPLFHSGVWLLMLGLLVAVLIRQRRRVVPIMQESWTSGKVAIFTTALFCILAEVLSLSGIATSLAAGMLDALGRTSVFLSMLLAALFGLVTNSANASNGLLMNSQLALAHGTGLSALGAAALQHASAIAMSTFSPVRIMLACSFAGVVVGMRDVYRTVLPFMAVVAVIVLLLACVLLAYAGPALLVPAVG